MVMYLPGTLKTQINPKFNDKTKGEGGGGRGRKQKEGKKEMNLHLGLSFSIQSWTKDLASVCYGTNEFSHLLN